MSSGKSRLGDMDAKMVFGETMAHIASHDPSLTVVVSDYGRRLNLDEMRRRLPEAFVQCGIAEQSQLEVAAALANEGFHVVAPSYATFITARVLDQVRVLLGMMKSPVVLVGLSAGCEAGTLGASHMALEDIACMRTLPGMTVVCPADNVELAAVLEELMRSPRPAYVRISQYSCDTCVHEEGTRARIGRAEVLREADGANVALLSTGPLTGECLKAAELLSSLGLQVRVIEFATVKPLDTAMLDSLVGASLVVTVEDHGACGGFGSAVAEYLAGVVGAPRVVRLGMPDEYLAADMPMRLLEEAGLTAQRIAQRVSEECTVV